MIEKEDIKLFGLFFWGMNLETKQETGCPCFVSAILDSPPRFQITSLDDFSQSCFYPLEENDNTSPLQQMRKAEKEEVIIFLKKRSESLEKDVKNKEEALSKARANLSDFNRKKLSFSHVLEMLDRKPSSNPDEM